MFYIECRKLLLKQKIIVIILIFLVLKIIITLYSGYDSEIKIERNSQGYLKYIEQYRGKLTEEKSNMIDKEYAMINVSHKKIDDLQFKKAKEQISDEEYKSEMVDYYERQKNYAVFQVFYNQYFYAKERPDERYIMDDRGWNTLLGNNDPDYLLIFCLIIVLTPIFCYEYECDMRNLILSTIKGKYQVASIKIITGCFFAIIITLLFSIIECLVMNYMVGLDNFFYPVQSLKSFEDCVYKVSIIESYICFVIFRLIGSLMIFGFISIFSVIFRRTIATLFFGSFLAITPFIIIKNRLNLFYLPVPSGLFLGNKFLSNIQDNLYFLIQFDIKALNQVNLYYVYLAAFLIINLFITVILLAISKKIYSKSKFKLRMDFKKTRANAVIFIIFVLFFLVGCSSNYNNDISLNVRLEQSSRYGETDNYKVYFDVTQNKIIAENKNTNEKVNILRDPISVDERVEGIFVKDNRCYYLEKQLGKSGFRIYGVDLNNFRKKLVYNSLFENIEDFFGFITKDTENDILKTMVDYMGFYLDNNFIYYFDYSNNLIQINRHTKIERVIAIDVYNGLYSFFYNNNIYYSDTQARLCYFDSKIDKVKYINNIYTNDFIIENDRLIYKDLLNSNNIKIFDLMSLK